MTVTVPPQLVRQALSSELVQRHQELYADRTRPLDEVVRIEDPAFYVDPWPIFSRLQDESPVHFYEPLNTWIVTRFEDVQHISRNPDPFSSRFGKLLYDSQRTLGLADMFAGDGDIIGLTDPPRHRELRRIMSPPFTPPALASIQPKVKQACERLVADLPEDEPVDWVAAVASRLPVETICLILGIEPDQTDVTESVRCWADAVEKVVSEDVSDAEVADCITTFRGLNGFITDLLTDRRVCPRDDFLTSLLKDQLDDRALSHDNVVGFAQLLIAGGVETTRSLLAELVAHLAVYEGERDRLVADLSLAPQTVEEVLRFAPAARGFARQATRDVELRGCLVHEGQRVYMAYDAANRDPRVFERPHEFDISRSSNRRNLAFGHGTHVCIAAPLVRIEARTLLEVLFRRFNRVKMAPGGCRVESFLRNGWERLPVVFSR